MDYNGNVIGDSIANRKCRTIILNKNYYVCPKIIDLNTLITLDPNDPYLKYKDGRQFISTSNMWYKDKEGLDILNNKYSPYFLNKENKKKYFPINKQKSKTKKEGNNSIVFNLSKNIYPGVTQNNLPCCFIRPNKIAKSNKNHFKLC